MPGQVDRDVILGLPVRAVQKSRSASWICTRSDPAPSAARAVPEIPGEQIHYGLQVCGEFLPVPRRLELIPADHSRQQEPPSVADLPPREHAHSPVPAARPAAIAAPVSAAVR